MFKAVHLLKDGGLSPTVVCTRSLRDESRSSLRRSATCLCRQGGLREQISLLGPIDRADQIRVMRCAAAAIQPSRFEGWSTVVEDAKGLVVPCSSRTSTFTWSRFRQVGSARSVARAR